ncbi:Methyltransferase domain-containing protein [Mucilaginibacter mallensis]|uniref:Methyltransferase domain-containing protein n=1 Tax=Mucilaginibacter mallensis TaxID=652787 RepID=A0A1H1PGW1_MUCMA|nr:class I SAM-dependent methyltransferase [Mucilaginibacter mallensis]SDS10384.1 Methyltransferase domain-containing protein [Mucilaginibacter mallensis]
MIAAIKNYIKSHVVPSHVIEKGSAEAYDIWSANYDDQPGNLMIDLDEQLFSNMLHNTNISNKLVADIGCGSGRHWSKLLGRKPMELTGFDVSAGMLSKLKGKFPESNVKRITDDLFSDVPDASFDMIVSTLTVAHIEDIDAAMQAWSRILKYDAEIMITDFHPRILAYGGQRTFKHEHKSIAVKNYVHPVFSIVEILQRYDFHLTGQEELIIDETMKHYYEKQNALPVYNKYKGFPVIYGIYLKRGDVA